MSVVAVEVRASGSGVSLCLLDYVSAFHTVLHSASMTVQEAFALSDLMMGRGPSMVSGGDWTAERSEGVVAVSFGGAALGLEGRMAVSAGLMLSAAALAAEAMEGSE